MRGFALLRFTAEITVPRVSHTGMLIVMTVDTEEFPVAAIGGIIVMIVITVVNGQLDQVLRVKLARAATAYRDRIPRDTFSTPGCGNLAPSSR